MDASKKNAKRALELVRDSWILQGAYPPGETSTEKVFVQQFLEAAIKRLPSQKAIDKDRKRRRSKIKA